MTPFFESDHVTIWNADARTAAELLEPDSVDAIVTSPPYFGLRDYGVDGQVGLEQTPEEYVEQMAGLLTSYVGPLKDGGSLWLNLGDTYAPDKCLLMIPERVALALIGRGWILRNRVVWAKPNGMPTSATDRLATKHEALFHFVRQRTYFYDLDAIREPPAESTVRIHSSPNVREMGSGPWKSENYTQDMDGKAMRNGQNALRRWQEAGGVNPGDVWEISTQPYSAAHFAVFPPELVRRPILATVPLGGVVLDTFLGSGTTADMARRLGRKAVGIELNPEYCRLAADRFAQAAFDFSGGAA